jgi:hypothetical protein
MKNVKVTVLQTQQGQNILIVQLNLEEPVTKFKVSINLRL